MDFEHSKPTEGQDTLGEQSIHKFRKLVIPEPVNDDGNTFKVARQNIGWIISWRDEYCFEEQTYGILIFLVFKSKQSQHYI